MDQIRPSRGKARGRPQIASDQQGSSGLSQGIRGPRPIHSTQFIGPRPIISQPTPTPQSFPTPRPGAAMQRPPRQMPPRAAGAPQQRAPQQRAPRPYAPRPVVSSDISSAPRQDLMAGVQQVTEGLKTLDGGGGDTPLPLGRGAVRGRRQIDLEHYRTPRPQSSLGEKGKQGTTGQPVKLLANYFPITSYTNWCLYQYRVDYNPEEDRISTKKGLLAQHRERLGGYLFDGTMLFSGSRYDPPNFELTSTRRSDDQKIVITVKFTNVIETGDYANIQVFNLLLRNCLRHLNLTLIGRNFYDSKAIIELHQHKLQLWPGYETTIGRYEDNILLCAEISTKVMRQDTVLDFLNQCATDRNRDRDWMIKFKSGIVGTTVMTKYNNETYRIDDVDENSDPTSEFSKKDGSKISYIQYYKEKYNLTIRGGRQPMLISKNKRSIRQFGIEDTLVYLVPELCVMTGITDAMRNNFTLMKDMATYTRINPRERTERLTNFANRLLNTPKSVAELKNWNLTLSNRLVELTARTLQPETIQSRTNKYNGGNEADWTKCLRALPMFTSAIVKHWVILAPKENCREVDTFAQSLAKAAQGMSFILPRPAIVPMNDGRSNSFLMHIEQVLNESNPALILCVIPSSRGDVYSLIKRKLCIDRAVPSQVVLAKNVQKNNMSVCTKIAIQINCKLGGAPWLVTIPKKGMMIIGFDVCHDSQRKNISFGALVANMNDTHTSYFSCVEPHESGQELSVHFATGVIKALAKYKTINGTLPSCIVVYRDGVGEGQISHVHKTEVRLLQTACEQVYGTTAVPFAFIIVTKRISTRFFAPSKSGPENPQPGTVVDTVVTDPTKYDFFLVSQHVRQGTVTPTHYNVIEDTLKLPPDIMQRLTFKLTHMYYNWSGTVRVPAPCQFAHKLAFLTGQSLRRAPNTGLDELLFFL
ncbi:piwi-like protein Siwi isoform X1 [Melanaphis sacchari]|uniref:piwi-like protein Siwi isoform X1 n=2 Tax=Melanaphis sacchari TaxID=742174 RepID=UPI000DC15777|nr:piwi-like protein Siwi isoform X1 [Melanaphis sacchari]XP_025207262.1 piwi-like protein Siwi isoform X1 [Melanaphis sacchari]XP_025207263.1 piwi-like protein Siwi isoform X1 [Melanaphis sacchari]XP_025207264.1 piwi-like protein Siwi isoform X1 [Melanaphis sacchari]